MGGERQEHVRAMFSHETMAEDFEPPVFFPGVPSRSIRNRHNLLTVARRAGLVGDEEWEAIRTGASTLPIAPDRHGSAADKSLPYSVELWRKAKGLGRGRAVLACVLAHLLAMRAFVEENDGDGPAFDLLLEDNVRVPLASCASRIRETLRASRDAASSCHLRYYGWLGSVENLRWIYDDVKEEEERRRRASDDEDNGDDSPRPSSSVFTFPLRAHDGEPGTAVWGAMAYWISPEAYHEALMPALRRDVGSLLWKGRRMRGYVAKPIDKILPRKIMEHFKTMTTTTTTTTMRGIVAERARRSTVVVARSNGRTREKTDLADKYEPRVVHVAVHPAFYRAPMLRSTIHAQWDAEFCRSTEIQLRSQPGGPGCRPPLSWDDLWLSDEERRGVERRRERGNWDRDDETTTTETGQT